MNIFYFTKDVELNARLLDDKRVVKMVLETTQLLSTAIYLKGGISPYKPSHIKHPCTIWASKSKGNWNWLKRYGLALAKEYTKRYSRVHKCKKIIKSMKCPKNLTGKFFEPPQCMPNQYKSLTSTPKGYINYYINEKFNPNYFKRTEHAVYYIWKFLYNKKLLRNIIV